MLKLHLTIAAQSLCSGYSRHHLLLPQSAIAFGVDPLGELVGVLAEHAVQEAGENGRRCRNTVLGWLLAGVQLRSMSAGRVRVARSARGAGGTATSSPR
ncbi:hypothetical protein [Streptomyces coffeae]|uniref:Uncharacterized protein n=1 Tax=Streptomyces coffeae TaxID=621382 RepID=A0ABS1NMA3_9ACTN|nr:hypothetical protein [Streptomyces coffeae]MBL1100990.1 hypothetical protein [Streptomyces coffeae]